MPILTFDYARSLRIIEYVNEASSFGIPHITNGVMFYFKDCGFNGKPDKYFYINCKPITLKEKQAYELAMKNKEIAIAKEKNFNLMLHLKFANCKCSPRE